MPLKVSEWDSWVIEWIKWYKTGFRFTQSIDNIKFFVIILLLGCIKITNIKFKNISSTQFRNTNKTGWIKRLAAAFPYGLMTR